KPLAPVLLPLELARRRLTLPVRWWVGIISGSIAVVGIATALLGTHWIRAATVGVHQASPLGGVHWLVDAGLAHRDAVLAAAAALLFEQCKPLREHDVLIRQP